MAAGPAVGVPHADESAAVDLSPPYSTGRSPSTGGPAPVRTPAVRGWLHAVRGVGRVEVGVRVLVEVELAALAAEVVGRAVVLAREGRRLRVDLHAADRVDRNCHGAASWVLPVSSPVLPGSIRAGVRCSQRRRSMDLSLIHI